MNCKRCGNQIPDNASYCNFCGTNLMPYVQTQQVSTPEKPKHKALPWIIIGSALLLAAIISISIYIINHLSFNNKREEKGYEAVIDKYFKSIEKYDLKMNLECFPDGTAEIEMLEDGYTWKELENDWNDFCEDFRVAKYKIVYEEKRDSDKLEDIREDMESFYYGEYYMDPNLISAAYKLEVYVTYTDDPDDEDEIEFEVLEYDGEWYIFDMG